MLNVLPYHLLKSIYQLLDPSDLSHMMSVDSRDCGFINKYRDLFRKKNVLLRLKGANDHILLEVFAAEFSRKAPRRIKLFAHDVEKLSYLPGMSIRSVVVEGTSDSNNRLLTTALERLEVYPECSVTFKNIDFTGTDVETVRGFLESLTEIPLLRIKACTFPSDDFASHLLNGSKIMTKTYSFEDDYSTILGSTQPTGHLGDQLLSDFLTGKGEKMSLSLTEQISWTGITRFIEMWRKAPREFTSVSFIRTAAFNDETRGADADFSRVFTSPHRAMKLLFLLLAFFYPIFSHRRHDGIPRHIHEKLKKAHSFLDVVDRLHVIYHPEKTNSHIEKTFPTSAPRSEMRIMSGSFFPAKGRKVVTSHSAARNSADSPQNMALHDDVDSHTADHLSLFSSIRQGNDTCQLQSVCVPVPVNNEDPQIVIFPKCYEVMQCVGSCCESFEKCHPHSIRQVQKPIIELIYVGNDRFMLNKTMNITMEEHLSCSCLDCGPDPPQCADGFVLGASCECECVNRADRNNCRGTVSESVETNRRLTETTTVSPNEGRVLEGGVMRRAHHKHRHGHRGRGHTHING